MLTIVTIALALLVVVVAPLEVFSRTVTYGEQGGVERWSEASPEEG